MDNLCINTLCYKKAVSDNGIISKIYFFELYSLFFCYEVIKLDKARLIIKKLEWLKKNNKFMSFNSFDLLKYSYKIPDLSRRRNGINYTLKFRLMKVLDNFKNKPSDIKIMDYAVLASLADRAKNKEVTAIVRNFYTWLQTNHPEILEPIFREFKEHESNIYTISGAA